MEPIRILYAIEAIGRGGTELQLKGLIDRLDRERFEPHLVTFRPSEDGFLPADCPHLGLRAASLASPRSLANARSVASYLRRRRIDIVQTFFQDPTILVGAAARLAGTPARIASFRDLGFWRTRRQEALLRLVYRGMTGFLANSEAVKEHFRQADGLDPAAITVIPNGLDPAAITCTPPRPVPRRVGIVGNLNRPVKRIDLFVEAAGLLAERHPAVRWEIVGDGNLRPALERRAAELGLADRLVFLGRLSEVAEVIAHWDVGVLCSDSEGFSNALLEYMLAGCTVVATDVGGNSEAVSDGRTGLLVPAGDAPSLAAALERLLSDGALNGRLAAAARAEAERRFSWAASVAAHAAYYAEQAARAGRPAG